MSEHAPDGGFLSFKQRILYSLLRAGARVGIRLRMPMDAMLELFRMAYFQEARDRSGLELEPIADLFGKSLRTVSSLHRRYRSDFFAPELEIQFRRDIAAMLIRSGHTLAEVEAAFPDRRPEEVRLGVDDLLREGRIVDQDGTLRRNPSDHDFFDEANTAARVDGLNRQMDIIAETVWRRLLHNDPDDPALARSYVFAATDKDFDALLQELMAKLRRDCIAADANAAEASVHNRRAITFAAANLEDK